MKEFAVKHKNGFIRLFVWGLFLFIFLCLSYYLKSKNEFYVSPKTKIIIVACAGASMLFAFYRPKLPRWFSYTVGAILFLFTPFFLFYFCEPLINDMKEILPGALFWNGLILMALSLVFYSITQHLGISTGLTCFITYVLYIVDYYTLMFRGTPFILSDILSTRTAVGVMGHYSFVFSQDFMVTFYVLSLITSFACFVNHPKKSMKHRLVLGISSGVIGMAIIIFLLHTDVLKNNGYSNHAFVPKYSAMRNGFALNCICAFNESFLKAPEGYSANEVERIINKYSNDSIEKEAYKTPNIIVVMNESFTDLSYLETVELTEEPIPKFKALKDNCIKGTLVSSIFGGNTPNSEFEFLTGCSLAFLPKGIVTYQQLIDKPLYTFATHMKELGYSTSAIHLYNPEYFSRNRIYPLLGFDKFENINNTSTEVDFFYDYAYDRCSFEAIKNEFLTSRDNPLFTFCVTIQNHGGYWHWLRDILVTNANSDYANDYASLIRITDDAFEEMLGYYSNIEEPTIIVMYGDHQPNLFDDFYDSIWTGCNYSEDEKTFMKAKVPFVIWANYDIEEKNVGTMSINYLGPMIMETANLPMSDFYCYLNDLRKKLPVISSVGFVDNNGNYFKETDNEEYNELLKEYSFLQYNYLKGNILKSFYE